MKTISAAERKRLLLNIERLAEHTRVNPELLAAHHFLYDLQCPPGGKPRFVVMGVNPGETEQDWLISPTPTEETSRFDFHVERGSGRSAIRWASRARFFLDGADYVLTELFFWSSKNSDQFKLRFGKLANSSHLALCVEMNQALIDIYEPEAVILPGLGNHEICRSIYGLAHEETIRHDGVRLVEHCTDGKRPWVFTKHWTAGFGFSTAQREAIREHIRCLQVSR